MFYFVPYNTTNTNIMKLINLHYTSGYSYLITNTTESQIKCIKKKGTCTNCLLYKSSAFFPVIF